MKVKAHQQIFNIISFEKSGVWAEDRIGQECFLENDTFSLVFHPLLYLNYDN
mgnify:CR=1 FL=1|jgi:hypothetical protein